MTRLLKMMLPSGICREKEMYYRGEGFTVENGEIRFFQNGKISFDTYFNGYSYKNALQYTHINEITFKLNLKGNFTVQLIKSNVDINREKFENETESQYSEDGMTVREEILQEMFYDSSQNEEFILKTDISDFADNGMIFLRLTSLSDNGIFYGFEIINDAEKVNQVKIGIVICTFKREKYVLENSRRILEFLDSNPSYKDKIDLFVIDNGKTLQSLPFGTVIPNNNTGGSGGFTRGIVEVSGRKEFSNFLLMDDDIAFDGEILARTIGILEYAKDIERLTVGASMIIYSKPYFQHEKGAEWKCRYTTSKKYGYDLRLLSNILRNDFEEQTDYTAWWYCCMSTKTAERIGLPFPFFIKCDDIEYSLRAENDIYLTNGIGVWHENFNSKFSPELEYYIKRNELILNALHRKDYGIKSNIIKLLRTAARQLIYHRYNSLDYVFLGYEDFLKGPDYFLSLDAEKNHIKIRSKNIKQYTKEELKEQGYDIDKKDFYDVKYKKSLYLKQLFTLNGYLIPKFLYPNNEKNSFRLIEINRSLPRSFYKSNITVQYNVESQTGFVTKIKKSELLKTGFKLFCLISKFIFKFNKVSKEYRNKLLNKKP